MAGRPLWAAHVAVIVLVLAAAAALGTLQWTPVDPGPLPAHVTVVVLDGR